jgi:hypothetical protein
MQGLTLSGDAAPSPRLRRRPLHDGGARSVARVEDVQYAWMHDTFVRNGGLAHEDALVQRLRRAHDQPISMLAHWIVDRTIVSFRWRCRTLVPMFQFDDTRTTPRAAARDVVRELVDVFDDWELCLWFAQPNTWLDGARPVERVLRDPRAVHEAARADRFIARG